MNTIVALYDDRSTAMQVVQEIRDYGVSYDSVEAVDTADSRLSDQLTQGGLPHDDVRAFVEGVNQGGTLVLARVEKESTDTVVDIMNRAQPIDIHERAATWRQSGWNDTATTESQSTRNRTEVRDQEGETAIPIVEEEVRVGKRQVAGGGVRVHTRIEEQPVEEQVRLREESVTVERRPVNRPVDADTMSTFQEGEFEVNAVKEEAVVQKEARVVEEVVVKKQAEEHTETIRDTVRRTEVDVEPVTGQTSAISDFRTHYQTNYANSGYSYEQYEPAYRYGSMLASDQRYQGRDWNSIEADARRDWNNQYKDSAWDNFKDAVRHSWQEAKSAVKR